MAKERMRSVDATIKREMGTIFTREIFPLFPNCLITITDVKTSPDLRYCAIYISILGDKTGGVEVFKTLERRKQEFYKLLSSRLRMKFTPALSWRSDDTPEQADYMTQLLNSLDIPEDEEEGDDNE